MAKNPFRAVKLANRATAKLLRSDTNHDFKVTQQGLDAILANLTTTQTGLGTALSSVNQRALNAMNRIANRDQNKLDAIVARGKSTVANRYGSAIAGTPGLFRGAETIARTEGKVNKGALKAGELQSQAGNAAMDILAQAAQTAASSGQHELALALRDRSQADAATIAANRLALQQQQADAAANERYLRLQTRLANGGTGGEGFQSAANALVGLQQDGQSRSQAEGILGALAVQYNLGPDAVAKLNQMVDSLWPSGSDSTTVSTPEGEAFRQNTGVSPSAYLGPDASNSLNHKVWEAYQPGQEVPTTAEAMNIAGIVRKTDGKAYVTITNAQGAPEEVPLSEDYVAATIAFIQSTWRRIAATAGAAAPATTTATPSATPTTAPPPKQPNQ